MSAAELVDYCFLSFDDINLKPELLQGISAYGLEKPSMIHQHGVIPIIRGHDCIIQAPAGIARMTTLCIGIIQRLDMTVNGIQAMILTNDPETAKTFHKAISTLGQDMHVDVCICIGDTKEKIQIKHSPPHILVGTVASAQAAITRGGLDISTLKVYCLDDGEQLLTCYSGKEASFGTTLDAIHEWLPKESQVVVASSAIADGTVEMLKEIMNHSITIAVPEEADTGDDTRQEAEGNH